MKSFFKSEYFVFTFLFIILIYITVLQSTHQDFTSIIDFDLTVIHNSLQIVSNEFPDFQDLTAYSHFLSYGIIYKIFGLFDKDLVTNIELLVNNNNPEIILQKLYIISRLTNAVFHLVLLFFIYKVLSLFNINKYFSYLILILIIFSETFIANFTILRTDIVAVSFFVISNYFLFKFKNDTKIYNLFFVGLFLTLALLAKVQIIFLYMFIFFFFLFFSTFSGNSKLYEFKIPLFIFKLINTKYILLTFILLFFLFQFFLNNFVETNTGVGYFDTLCFSIFFIIMFFSTQLLCKYKKIKNEYLFNIFNLIIFFIIFSVFLLKILDFFNIIKFDFRIIFSLTNPFYFLKIYSPINDNEFSLNLIFETFKILFSGFKFDFYYLLLIFIVIIGMIMSSIISKERQINRYINIYIVLMILMIIFLSALNNFRYNISYNIYLIPFISLMISLFFEGLNIKSRTIFSLMLLIIIIFNLITNIDNYKQYKLKPSKLDYVCTNKSTRDFYYYWARKFDEGFFKRICYNKNLSFK